MNGMPSQFDSNYQFTLQSRQGLGCRFWFGLGFLLVGTALLLQSLGFAEFGYVLFTYWPSVLMIAAVVSVARGKGSLLGSGILFIIGALLQAGELELLPGGFWAAFWPLMFVLLGLSMLFGRRFRRNWKPGATNRGESASDAIDRVSVFGSQEFRVTSQSFTGGDLVAVFGSIEVDLRNADIAEPPVDLEIVAVFGSVTVRVPPHWTVELQSTPIFGSAQDLTTKHPDSNVIGPVLRVDATASFGSVEIRT